MPKLSLLMAQVEVVNLFGQVLGQKFNFLHIDTGALYRALAVRADQLGVELGEEKSLANFLASVKLRYAPTPQSLVEVDGEDYSLAIRTPRVAKLASAIATISSVRHFLVSYQRELARERVSVMEGRDIGTVVFPHAFIKFFVTASLATRATRRWKELREKGQGKVKLEEVLQQESARDKKDMERKHSPLVPASDAILIDSSNLTLEEVLDKMALELKKEGSKVGLAL